RVAVRPASDRLGDGVRGVAGVAAEDIRRIGGGILRLTIEVLGRAFGLPELALDLRAQIVGGAAVGFLRLADIAFGGPGDSVVCHDFCPLQRGVAHPLNHRRRFLFSAPASEEPMPLNLPWESLCHRADAPGAQGWTQSLASNGVAGWASS